jgi:protein required for attachment to host cells
MDKEMHMENDKTWIVVADSSHVQIFAMYKAKFFKTSTSQNLESVDEYTYADLHQPTESLEIKNDEVRPKSHEAEVFANEVLKKLSLAKYENQFKDLIIIAPPTFMGLLDKHMTHELQKIIIHKIEKDYTHQTKEELIAHLLNYL